MRTDFGFAALSAACFSILAVIGYCSFGHDRPDVFARHQNCDKTIISQGKHAGRVKKGVNRYY
jgi:hypothetical protein